ncbi:MAG TPA: hypothetical protein PKA61_08365 [Nitrospira sp.]|nr:hypothetical protein [Nitrospira sp.]
MFHRREVHRFGRQSLQRGQFGMQSCASILADLHGREERREGATRRDRRGELGKLRLNVGQVFSKSLAARIRILDRALQLVQCFLNRPDDNGRMEHLLFDRLQHGSIEEGHGKQHRLSAGLRAAVVVRRAGIVKGPLFPMTPAADKQAAFAGLTFCKAGQ